MCPSEQHGLTYFPFARSSLICRARKYLDKEEKNPSVYTILILFYSVSMRNSFPLMWHSCRSVVCVCVSDLLASSKR